MNSLYFVFCIHSTLNGQKLFLYTFFSQKDLSQNQVSEQLESLSQSTKLGFSKLPSKDDQNTLTAFLHSDEFYFEIPINVTGEIGDVKFAMFHEPPQVSFYLCNLDLFVLNVNP
jgi:hypothetical protein